MTKSLHAPVLSHTEFLERRKSKAEQWGRIVATSGGYDPIHPGHISCIIESQKLGDTMVVIVNGDDFLTQKKGRPFQSLETRCMIVSSIVGVDYVVAFEIEGDTTVTEALRCVQPHIFSKGGDRIKGKSLPASEEAVCKEFDIRIVDGVGEPKLWSSSDSLRDWTEFKLINFSSAINAP